VAGVAEVVAGRVLATGAELELLDNDDELGGGVDTMGAAEDRSTGWCRALRFRTAALRRCFAPADMW
jgi:hypothetical protein